MYPAHIARGVLARKVALVLGEVVKELLVALATIGLALQSLADVGAVDVQQLVDLLLGGALKDSTNVLSFHACPSSASVWLRSALLHGLDSFASSRTKLRITKAHGLMSHAPVIPGFRL